MQNSRRGRTLGYGFLSLLCIGAAVMAAVWTPSDPSLLKKATRITPLRTSFYCWRSPHLLLLNGHQPLTRKMPFHDIVQLDCITGRKTPVAALNRNREYRFGCRRGRISPNANWIVFDAREETVAIELDTGRKVVSAMKSGSASISYLSRPLWYPDNRRWVYLRCNIEPGAPQSGFYAFEQGLNPAESRLYPAFGYPLRSTYWDGLGCRPLGFIAQDRVLALPGFSLSFSDTAGNIALCEFSVGAAPKLKEVTIPIPSGSRGLALALSPDSKRLAILIRHFQRPRLSPIHHLLSRWWPRLLPKKKKSILLYTVQTDGTRWRALGQLPPDVEDRDYDEEFFRLEWLPDGKRLSFILQDELWTVPVTP